MKSRLKSYSLSSYDVSERAYNLYSDSSFTLYRNINTGIFYLLWDGESPEQAQEMGNMEDVEKYLLSIAKELDEMEVA